MLKELIEKRKSVRKYKEKDIPKKLIKEIIDAARLAPSACNAQPTRYFIAKDKEIKDKSFRELIDLINYNLMFYADKFIFSDKKSAEIQDMFSNTKRQFSYK